GGNVVPAPLGEDKNMTNIEYRNLGPSGLRVSALGLGGNNFGRDGTATESQEGTNAVLAEALELGVTFIDTADIYGNGNSETLIGNAIAGKRDQFVIASKFGHSGFDTGHPQWGAKGSRQYIRHAIDRSL